jgi:hypothetical protein
MIAVWPLYGSTLSLFCTRELMDLLHVARLRCIYIPKSHRNITKLLAVSSLAHTGIGCGSYRNSASPRTEALYSAEKGQSPGRNLPTCWSLSGTTGTCYSLGFNKRDFRFSKTQVKLGYSSCDSGHGGPDQKPEK